MVFSSTVFLFLFLPLCLLIYYNGVIRGRAWKNAVLLVFSLLFYAWGEPVFVFVMIGSIAVNWFAGLQISRSEGFARRRRGLLIAAVGFNVALLFAFKYLGFVMENVRSVTGGGFMVPEIALPVGISFFTFQIMSYVVDVYRKDAPAQKSVLDVALYVSMFPQLIAGPIVRYQTVAEEIKSRAETRDDFTAGVSRFVFGLGKKMLIANYAGVVADSFFNPNVVLSVSAAWFGAAAYAVQIYFDFSGYSDMAIGFGRMFGFHFLENFNYPYAAGSVTDFWRRWHISLGTWFRDYVYIPLGGSRRSKARNLLNLLAVWSLTGIWHGANWTFFVWGLFYFVLLQIERMTGRDRAKGGWVGRAVTLFFVMIGWVIFRAESLPAAWNYLSSMLVFGAPEFFGLTFQELLDNGLMVVAVGAALSFPVLPALKKKLRLSENICLILKSAAMAAVFLLSLLAAVKSTYNPFIYFNF